MTLVSFPSAPNASASPATTVASPSPSKPVTSSSAPVPLAPSSTPTNVNNKKEPLNFDILDDKTRNACLKLIHQALAADSTITTDDEHAIFAKAKKVEEVTFSVVGKKSVNGDYRTKIRSLSFNLKDKNNPTLREGVVSGTIEAEKLVVMTPEEMASDERKAERSALQMQNLFKAKAAAAQGGCRQSRGRSRSRSRAAVRGRPH